KKVSEQEPEDPTQAPAQPQKPVGPQGKLSASMPIDTWRDRFQSADPEQYHQFRQNNRPGTKKDPEHIERMAVAAHYKARHPNK
ncbi:MAG: hypothetical protein EBX47_11150, partial [Synechococcaceae bacterium WB8_1B_057]|nr:hypothetical protein [Synechococcaceae bacterium WB8_1B_057]